MIKQCLLAPNQIINPSDLKYPQIVSPKMDGIRCIIYNGSLLSRSLKPIPNNKLYSRLETIISISANTGLIFDGELYNHDLSFSDISSIVMSQKPVDLIHYSIFDCLTLKEWSEEITEPYSKRLERLRKYIAGRSFHFTNQSVIDNVDEFNLFYEYWLEAGYEGLITRNPNAQYKWRRATVNENIIYKFKPIETLDGIVIEEIPEREMKDIERTRQVTGALERPYTKDSYIISDRIGSLRVKINNDQEFPGLEVKIGFGKGWSKDRRKDLLGKKVEFTYMKYGSKNLPRMGKLLRVRYDK